MYRIPTTQLLPENPRLTRSLAGQKIDWGLHYTGLPEMWKLSKGEKTVVYIIDDGISVHEDLEGQIIARYAFNPQNSTDPIGFHGTFVAGIVAGIDNDKGIVGVAPKAKIVGIHVLNENAEGDPEDLAKAIVFATDHKTPLPYKVINISLGSERPDPIVREALRYAESKGVPVVCAAGNSGEETGKLDFPAGFFETISVGGHNQQGDPSPFSNSDSVGITPLDCIAPAENITSLVNTSDYRQASGTSFAAPFISGVIALMQGVSPNQLSGADVRLILRQTAVDIMPSGYDGKTGFGKAAPITAVKQAKNRKPKVTIVPPSLEESIKKGLNQLITLGIMVLQKVNSWLQKMGF